MHQYIHAPFMHAYYPCTCTIHACFIISMHKVLLHIPCMHFMMHDGDAHHAYYDTPGMHDTVGELPGLAVTVIVIIFIAVIICSQFDSGALNMARAAHPKAKATKYYSFISVVTLTATGLLC